MNRFLAALTLILAVSVPRTVSADIWGGDVLVLTQILANALQQLSQLRAIVGAGTDTLGLLRSVNQGINDSLTMMQTIRPGIDPGIYSNWTKADMALQGIQQIYGAVTPSRDQQVQRDTDRSVAEAMALNNSLYAYTAQTDQIGEEVKAYSHQTSPGGAQKLTAETLGVMLNVMNESLRTQATGLKMQAQTLAVQNHNDKEMTNYMFSTSASLQSAMQNDPVDFSIPRF